MFSGNILVGGVGMKTLTFSNIKKAVKLTMNAGHVPCIVGLQGIGKTDLVHELADEEDCVMTTITCSLLQEGDLAMPYLNGNNNTDGYVGNVSYAINQVITDLCQRAVGKKWGILFLDEFNRASEQAQSELMNLVLQRKILSYELPSNIRIVLAMNPNSLMEGYENTSYSVINSDSAIFGRILILNMAASLSEWLKYGKRTGINGLSLVHKTISSFLSTYTTEFITPDVEGAINNTPRGWRRVSDVLYEYEKEYPGTPDKSILKALLCGTLKESTADEFLNFYIKNYKTVDYFELAGQILYSSSVNDWDPSIERLTDAELDKLFKCMLDVLESDKSPEMLNNFVTYMTLVQNELLYAWQSYLEKHYQNLYLLLIDIPEFQERLLNVLSTIQIRESGDFVGKK